MSRSSNSNTTSVPEAKGAMNRFKQEVASELGISLKEGYNEISHPVRQVPLVARWCKMIQRQERRDVR